MVLTRDYIENFYNNFLQITNILNKQKLVRKFELHVKYNCRISGLQGDILKKYVKCQQ